LKYSEEYSASEYGIKIYFQLALTIKMSKKPKWNDNDKNSKYILFSKICYKIVDDDTEIDLSIHTI